ncbi:hypothetical protein MTS1_00090 [Microbacterium sp. TS-1]|uniref:Uncharacterized protein n=1 Tax=Microbacterium arborescens TaxID=33883 RepID=A0ABX2WFH4_9MICO|nr:MULTISPECIES: hypothetical protein [Microbacterium]OAZ39442.1 hypothetical protein A9Z40_06200 [Microbacterium arborescens]GAD32747.1 hypothetical protein MTS1_00090 [Microbacterium sp. TS-1]
MEERTSRRQIIRFRWAAAVAAIAGSVLSILAIGFDFSGFWGGFVLGAGVGSIVLAAYLSGLVTGMSRALSAPTWLPARETGSV